MAYGLRLVPKLLTLNDLEWHNSHYSALFHRILQHWESVVSK